MKGLQVSIAQTRNLTFIDTVISRSRVSDVALVLAGVVLVALSAQVELYVPPVPVPFTLQTLAVLLIGATYGAARGAITLSAYALVGLIGFPVFTNGGSGLEVLFGATGGFIIGFIFAAALIGKLAELKWSSNILKMVASYVLSSIVIYSIGIAVLAMVAYSSDLQKAFTVMIPFLAWDAVKAVIAGALLPSAWALVKAVKK
jgi:biotin transport system substrate-specific component